MTVRQFLTQHDLAAYADAFEAQAITISDLADLTDDELRSLVALSSFSDRKRFKSAVAGLTGAPAPSLSGPTRMAPTPTPTPTPSLSGPTRMAPTPTPTPTPSLSGPTRMDAPSAFPERLGNYRVLGLVGSGGMGTVVRARHTEEGWALQQGGDVAIKLIHPHIATDPAFRSRFMSEAAMGRKVQHRGFVTTWDVLSEGAWLGTVMSLVVGEPLTNKVVPGGLPVADVIRLLTPIAEALDYLHGLGIVHRDLKPANIVVRPDGQPVVLDLGIAKDAAALESQTRTMTTMGTSAWMAPEQADAKNVDGAADRYALGMIAYVLLSGRLPWEEGTSEVGVLVSKMTGKLVPLAQVRAGLPGHMVAAVMKMVSVDAGMRYATCVGFVGALREDGSAARLAAEAKVKADAAAKREAEAKAKESAQREAAARAAEAKRRSESPKPPEPPPLPSASPAHGTQRAPEKYSVPFDHEVQVKVKVSVPVQREFVLSEGWFGMGRKTEMRTVQEEQERTERRRESGTIDFSMAVIPPCTFTMGSPASEPDRSADETQHAVRLSRGFAVGSTPVTQALWSAVMGANPSRFMDGVEAPQRPVERVSWYDAVRFCNALSGKLGLRAAYTVGAGDKPAVTCDFSAPGFRLPTEAEWECAARAGTAHRYAGGDDLATVGWFGDNSGSTTHAVGQKQPNAWGIYDMSGNVWEWTSDWYGDYGGNVTDPTGASTGSSRVVRGGVWRNDASYATVSFRSSVNPGNAYSIVGFRLSRSNP